MLGSWVVFSLSGSALMSRPLQLLSLALRSARTGAVFTHSMVSLTRCISKGPNIHPGARGRQQAPRHRDEKKSDEEFELEEVEDKIQRVVDTEVKRQKTVKYHILRRQMTPRGPPERKLTWEAIEEIRYLNREQPEEWTVNRLAEGFAVSKDDIFRVLRNKFVPGPERKAKQDTQVLMKLKQQVLPSRARVEQEKTKLSSGSKQAVLTSGNKGSAVVPAIHQILLPQTEPNPPAPNVVIKQPFSEGRGYRAAARSNSLMANPNLNPDPARSNSTAVSGAAAQNSQAVLAARRGPVDTSFSATTKHSTNMSLKESNSTESSTVAETDEEGWDRQVFSEENIEALMTTVKSTPVVKEGNEFFDGDGNFLYRI
ncbi:neugrin [Eucyclogobius newberryi]|uniref:neugrin n=1 Tax=Eucyclogobius newberryi TaxID=166745 RepID=UPI003B5B25EF